uniref:Uncharacterized protein n=1 Tax=Knipowitschia caucasica TaxID=637954 RepID=A0AAV2MIB6_KNICA
MCSAYPLRPPPTPPCSLLTLWRTACQTPPLPVLHPLFTWPLRRMRRRLQGQPPPSLSSGPPPCGPLSPQQSPLLSAHYSVRTKRSRLQRPTSGQGLFKV